VFMSRSNSVVSHTLIGRWSSPRTTCASPEALFAYSADASSQGSQGWWWSRDCRRRGLCRPANSTAPCHGPDRRPCTRRVTARLV
jgi:hypothetical protein